MKYFPLLLALFFVVPAHAKQPRLHDVYGQTSGGCTVDIDIDAGQADRIGPLDAGKLYVVYCYDSSSFAGLACRIKQGGSTVDASSGELADGEGELLFAGEKRYIWIDASANYVSFEPYAAGTTQVGAACRSN